MHARPFLTQFMVNREEIPCLNSIEIRYNRELDYNEVFSGGKQADFEQLASSTSTRIQNEKPDVIYCLQTTTVTKIKSESPDKTAMPDMSIFLATETFTKIISESPDKD